MKIKNIDELKAKILTGSVTEHNYENVELKRDWERSHGKKISMLCNGAPEGVNYLVVGVDDNGALSGHKNSWLKDKLEVMSQQCNEYLDPVMTLLDLTTENIDGNRIIIATIQNPGVVVKWGGNAWTGNGTTKRKLEPHEILELSLKLPGLQDVSKFTTEYNPSNDLVEIFCNLGSFENDGRVLDRFHLSKNRCGKILLGETHYRVIKYDVKSKIIGNETRTGLLNVLTDDFFKEIRGFYATIFDSSRISDVLLREAMGNAVGHAAYHENDGELIIELYPNKIHVSNLAYSEYLSLANKWFSSAHKSPNPFLMETLRVINRVDELGGGKKKLLAECLVNGFNSPNITITNAGRYKRWTLAINFGASSTILMKIYDQLQELYGIHSEKSLISYALVLWRDKNFSEIAKYFDSHESKVAADILSDFKGPLFYWKEEDRVILHRWVKVLLEEGKLSKSFTHYEEQQLLKFCKDIHNKYHDGLITPKEFREMAHLSNSKSDQSLTTKMLNKWINEKELKRIKRGVYRFTDKATVEVDRKLLKTITEAFEKTQKSQN